MPGGRVLENTGEGNVSRTAMSFDGDRVVVIGGGTGIGFAIAELASELGADLVIGSSNEANVASAAKRLKGATGHVVDLRDEASVAHFFEKVGAFDHLAITAGDWGGPMFVSTRELDLTQAKDLLTVRFWGVLAAAKHCSRTIAKDGSITFTSGMFAHRPRKGNPMATAIGGAIEHLARGLAIDLAPLRVNVVCPGFVLTDHLKEMPEAMLQQAVSPLPVPRSATPAEAAKAYIYLMLNDYATGQVLPVDGGGLLV